MIPALIMVTTIATSSTGGNYAGPGGVVETGSQSASSYVETHVDGGGTTTIDIQTQSNGVASSTREVVGSSSVPVRIEVYASSHSTPVAHVAPRVSVHATSTATSTTIAAAATTSPSTSSLSALVVPAPDTMVPPSIAARIVRAIVSFFRSLFGI